MGIRLILQPLMIKATSMEWRYREIMARLFSKRKQVWEFVLLL